MHAGKKVFLCRPSKGLSIFLVLTTVTSSRDHLDKLNIVSEPTTDLNQENSNDALVVRINLATDDLKTEIVHYFQ